MISQGASQLNLSLVVAERTWPRRCACCTEFFRELDPAVFE